MSARPHRLPTAVICLCLSLFVAASVFALRFERFADIEPRSDQAFFIWWVQGLAEADHVMPEVRPGESFRAALQRDDTGALNRLLRPIYAKAIAVFTAVPLGLRTLVTAVWGPSLPVQVASSIAASAGIVFLLGMMPLAFRRPDDPPWRLLAETGATLLVGASVSYLHWFSPWGNHNFGALFLVLAVAVCGRLLMIANDGGIFSRRLLTAGALMQGLALYAHWTNVFLLPAATLLALLFAHCLSWRRRLVWAAVYVAFTSVVVGPFLVAAVVEASHRMGANLHSVSALTGAAFHGGIAGWAAGLGDRAADWFIRGGALFSPAGLVLGLAGLFVLARWRGIVLPLAVVLVHFGVWNVILIFGSAYMRTFVYVLPFLALGVAVVLAESVRLVWRAGCRWEPAISGLIGTALVAIGLWHLADQWRWAADPAAFQRRLPEVWAMYYEGQGTTRPVLAEIDQRLPAGAIVLPADYGVGFLLRDFGVERPGRQAGMVLSPLLQWLRMGGLRDHIEHLGLSLPKGRPYFVLADLVGGEVSLDDIKRGVPGVLGDAGIGLGSVGGLTMIGDWRLTSSWPGHLVLWRVDFD